MATVTGGDKMGRALDRISARAENARRVQVGFAEGAKYPNGTSIATAAAANNWGAPSRGIPPRPFWTTALDAGKKTWPGVLSVQLKRLDFDAAGALGLVGGVMAGDFAASLVATNGPALSPVTLLLRQRFPLRVGMTFADVQQARHDVAAGTVSNLSGSAAKPLVWTGEMLNHLQGPEAVQVS